MRMPNSKYIGSYMKSDFQTPKGTLNAQNSSYKKYYAGMVDAPGFKDGGRAKMPARNKKNFRPTKSGAGMTQAGVKAYRRLNPGSKLKTAVTGKVTRADVLKGRGVFSKGGRATSVMGRGQGKVIKHKKTIMV